MTRPSFEIADSGTSRLPLGSRITFIVPPLDAISHIEVEHHAESSANVTANHLHQGRALTRRDRGECVSEELAATQMTSLTVEVADHPWLALQIELTELSRVRLPATNRSVDVVESMTDLM